MPLWSRTPHPHDGPYVKLTAHPVKTGQARRGLPGNEDMIVGSALTPLRESVTAFLAPA